MGITVWHEMMNIKEVSGKLLSAMEACEIIAAKDLRSNTAPPLTAICDLTAFPIGIFIKEFTVHSILGAKLRISNFLSNVSALGRVILSRQGACVHPLTHAFTLVFRAFSVVYPLRPDSLRPGTALDA